MAENVPFINRRTRMAITFVRFLQPFLVEIMLIQQRKWNTIIHLVSSLFLFLRLQSRLGCKAFSNKCGSKLCSRLKKYYISGVGSLRHTHIWRKGWEETMCVCVCVCCGGGVLMEGPEALAALQITTPIFIHKTNIANQPLKRVLCPF